MNQFKVVSDMIPRGDQPEAINALVRGAQRRPARTDTAGCHRVRQDIYDGHVIEKVHGPPWSSRTTRHWPASWRLSSKRFSLKRG